MLEHQSHNSRGNNNYNAFTYSNKNWLPHFHKNLELICVLHGSMTLTVNETEVVMEEGECALILSNQIHSFRIGKTDRVWIAVFSEDFVPEFSSYINDKQGRQISFRPDWEVWEVIEQQLILPDASFMTKRGCFYLICDQYLKKVELEDRKTKNTDLICLVLDYIAAHYTEDITLTTIATEFGYEYHYLSRLLNQHYNIRIKDIINEHRINCAIRHLEKGELNMTEIAMQSGFRSIRSFNEVFLALTGNSPTDYRKRNR